MCCVGSLVRRVTSHRPLSEVSQFGSEVLRNLMALETLLSEIMMPQALFWILSQADQVYFETIKDYQVFENITFTIPNLIPS